MRNFKSQKISEIGHGTWGMGSFWGPRDDRGNINALIYAMNLGINFIDTAWMYGEGHSEEVIGSALRQNKMLNDVFIASKVPPKNFKWPARHNEHVNDTFPKSHILEYTEKSLKNLRRDYLDLQQIHVWSDNWTTQQDWLEIIQNLKASGKIKYFGISINDHEPNSALKMVESGLIDSVQVIYNIFDQSPEEKLFTLCQKMNVKIIARVPFDEGALTGNINSKTKFHKKDWRKHYFTPERLIELEKRILPIQEFAKSKNLSLAQLALQFCLSHPQVTTVIPGMRKKDHVQMNTKASELAPLTKNDLEFLKKQKWPKNFYPSHG